MIRLRPVVVAAALGLLAAGRAFAADQVVVRATDHNKEGFGRIAFVWPAPVRYDARLQNNVLTVHFARPMTVKLDAIPKHLGAYVSSVRLRDDTTVVARVTPGATLRSFTSGNTVAIDIARKPRRRADALAPPDAAEVVLPPEFIEPAAGTPAPEPAASAPAPEPAASAPSEPAVGPPTPLVTGGLPVHATTVPLGVNLRFDWPQATGAAVFRRGGALWIVFAGATPLDLSEARQLGGGVVTAIEQIADDNATALRLAVRQDINATVQRKENTWIVELRGAGAAARYAADRRPVARLGGAAQRLLRRA